MKAGMAGRFVDECPDALRELMHVLNDNGIHYQVEKGGIRLAFSKGGRVWETVARSAPQTLLLYGLYPFEVETSGRLLSQLNEINEILVNGGLFVSSGRIVLRTGADLFDAYSAQESIMRALEYNAGAIVRFWHALQSAAQ